MAGEQGDQPPNPIRQPESAARPSTMGGTGKEVILSPESSPAVLRQELEQALQLVLGESPEKLVRLNTRDDAYISDHELRENKQEEERNVKNKTNNKVFLDGRLWVVPISEAAKNSWVIDHLLELGARKGNLEFYLSEGLRLDQKDEARFSDLHAFYQRQEHDESASPPLFMAPFWNRTLNSTYKLLAERKHEQFAKTYPKKPDDFTLYEDAFSALLKDYFKPFVERLERDNSNYHEGRRKYPTNPELLKGQDLTEAMEKASREVIFAGSSDGDVDKKVHGQVWKLVEEVQDLNLRDYIGLPKLLTQWEKLPQGDDLAPTRWAIVCAPLEVYCRRFILAR